VNNYGSSDRGLLVGIIPVCEWTRQPQKSSVSLIVRLPNAQAANLTRNLSDTKHVLQLGVDESMWSEGNVLLKGNGTPCSSQAG
jgi:hypothetical protein